MSTSDVPRHDSNVDVEAVSTQPSTPPLTPAPASALPSQQSPESESQSESQGSSVTEAGDSVCDDETSELELDANGVHMCEICCDRYLDKLKKAFCDRSEVFLEMDDMIRDYFAQRLVTARVVQRVNLLLAREPRLLRRFYRFLPFEWQR